MSRGCYKTYGRKVGPTTHTSIQFDKLFCENSNKPSASKSAGTVGKWGITSFTSIRSTHFTVGRRDDHSSKRSREAKAQAAASAVEPPSPSDNRPKKFFKSRNVVQEKPKPPPPPPPTAPLSKQYSRPASRPARLASIVAARKLVDTLENEEYEEEEMFQTEAINLSAPMRSLREPSPPPPPSPPPASHPPIVLRIFKGTAQLLTEEEVLPAKKDGRRRSYGSDSSDSTTPPKKHKNKYKEYEIKKEEAVEAVEVATVAVEETHEDKEAESEQLLDEGAHLLAETVVDIERTGRLLQETRAEGEEEDEEEDVSQEYEQGGAEASQGAEVLASEPAVGDSQEEKNPDVGGEEKPLSSGAAMGQEFYRSEDWASDTESVEGRDGKLADEMAEHPEPPPAVERAEPRVEPLVLRRPASMRPAKKGSIFKSRASSGEKRNAHYIHKWSDNKDDNTRTQESSSEHKLSSDLAAEFDSETLTRVTNYSTKQETTSEEYEPITSVTCSKKAKEFYTVVRNVKKAHQIQESGEFQEFNDDVEYILDALQDNNLISTRCLSAITLASKCMVPAFRMHVRAHGTVTKFFRALHDATRDQRLGMCTATVMFVLSQDRLNMDIDRDSLELMLSLLESDASHSSALEGCGLSSAELAKTKDRVRSLCQEIQEQGHAKHLNLDNITVGQLAMETLLSLTSRRAGEWFKEELRTLGGLEHIVRTVVETCRPIDLTILQWSPALLDRLRKADRCLRVLENVTLQNEENNSYLLTYDEGVLVDTVVRVLRVCVLQLPLYPTVSLKDKESVGAVIRECLVANLKVLINLTHDFNNKSFGSTLAGQREGVIESSLHILLEIPRYVPEEQKFDITVLALILLINLVEHCVQNRQLLINARAPPSADSMFNVSSVSAVSALVVMFLQQEELARTEERKTDAILDGEKQTENKNAPKSAEEFIEETVALLLQKAGRHMEHTLIGAYIALLLGYLIVDNEAFEGYVRSHMPNNNYEMLLSVLQKFYNFMMLTSAAGSGSSRGIKATALLITQLTEIDKAISAAVAVP